MFDFCMQFFWKMDRDSRSPANFAVDTNRIFRAIIQFDTFIDISHTIALRIGSQYQLRLFFGHTDTSTIPIAPAALLNNPVLFSTDAELSSAILFQIYAMMDRILEDRL